MKMDNGLLTIPLHTPTEDELFSCPIVEISSDNTWDPSKIDKDDVITESRISLALGIPAANTGVDLNKVVDDVRMAYALRHKRYPNMDTEELRKFLGWIPKKRVHDTLENTTTLARLDSRYPQRRHIKARFPQLKYKRLTETYCTDTLFASTKSLEGYTCAQLFVGKDSKYILILDIY